ncbi:hypothetical protein H4Q32_002328 [Labeo rohita]|uniref:CCHC-type domain-containing protein n=1 Tax=Labeo rohita TaxID=84645 RepID=A0ABQ8MMW4_LABRO|nr:hypothetical protein H4Q32_002328 [Labeo rohita]
MDDGQHAVMKDMNKTRSQSTAQSSHTCFCCGSSSHLANAPNCPATKVKCNKCGKVGHFTRVCRSEKKVQLLDAPESDVPEIVHVLEVEGKSLRDKIKCTVTIETEEVSPVLIELTVDTGSAVSILPSHLYKQHFSSSPLRSPQVKLVTYSEAALPVLGCLSAHVYYGDAVTSTNIYVVEKGTPILGMDLVAGLNIHIAGKKLISPPSPTVVRQVTAATTEGIGCAKGFVHRVKVRESVQPVQQKLCRLPLSVRNAVSKELCRLQAEGFIERVDASSWVSPIMVTTKKNGEIRLCVDLREPNRAVIIDSHVFKHRSE